MATLALMLAMVFCIAPSRAEDGYELWLRYYPLASEQAALYRHYESLKFRYAPGISSW
jgi:alpha-glucuronidase